VRNLPGIRCLGRNGARVGTTRQAPQANITWKHGDTQEREQAAALAAEEAKRQLKVFYCYQLPSARRRHAVLAAPESGSPSLPAA
jgi:hypothetical protein